MLELRRDLASPPRSGGDRRRPGGRRDPLPRSATRRHRRDRCRCRRGSARPSRWTRGTAASDQSTRAVISNLSRASENARAAWSNAPCAVIESPSRAALSARVAASRPFCMRSTASFAASASGAVAATSHTTRSSTTIHAQPGRPRGCSRSNRDRPASIPTMRSTRTVEPAVSQNGKTPRAVKSAITDRITSAATRKMTASPVDQPRATNRWSTWSLRCWSNDRRRRSRYTATMRPSRTKMPRRISGVVSSRHDTGTGSTASAPTARVNPMPSRPPRPTKRDAGRTLNARNAKHAAAKPDEHAGQPVLMREGGDPEQGGAGGQPGPGGQPVGVAEAVDRLHHHEDEQERAGHVERPDPGRAEARAREHRNQRGHCGRRRGQAVGVFGALDRDPDDGEQHARRARPERSGRRTRARGRGRSAARARSWRPLGGGSRGGSCSPCSCRACVRGEPEHRDRGRQFPPTTNGWPP